MQATDSNPDSEAEAAEEMADGSLEMGDRGSAERMLDAGCWMRDGEPGTAERWGDGGSFGVRESKLRPRFPFAFFLGTFAFAAAPALRDFGPWT
jgi:hypothetical protein